MLLEGVAGVVLLSAIVAIPVSCVIAQSVGCGARTWAWGLFGPVGWIVAALVGVQELLRGSVVEIAPIEQGAKRQMAFCPKCGLPMELFPAPGVATPCDACGTAIEGFAASRPRRAR